MRFNADSMTDRMGWCDWKSEIVAAIEFMDG
jgi:hypothetical protein